MAFLSKLIICHRISFNQFLCIEIFCSCVYFFPGSEHVNEGRICGPKNHHLLPNTCPVSSGVNTYWQKFLKKGISRYPNNSITINVGFEAEYSSYSSKASYLCAFFRFSRNYLQTTCSHGRQFF